MKTLHKMGNAEDYFLRVEDSTKADWERIKQLISEGWVFVDKAAYKAKVKTVLSELRGRHHHHARGG